MSLPVISGFLFMYCFRPPTVVVPGLVVGVIVGVMGVMGLMMGLIIGVGAG